jgi:glycine/D-amino acid oxidase-like deaminating enzyme/nitrite reductase/ring-hydroxylating ferredoxin subunit
MTNHNPLEAESRLPQFPESYWLASTEIPTFPKLLENITVDVAIVGAGISGITTAYLLTKAGFKVALLEAGRILNGTTGHTTAKITAQHDLIYDEFIHHFGEEKARLYYEANRDALQFIKQTVQDNQIRCDFSEQDAYIYTNSDNYTDKITNEFKAYEKLGIPGSLVAQLPLSIPIKAAVRMNSQAQFNPVLYLLHLVEYITGHGGKIYEQTTAMTVEKGTPPQVTTKDGFTVACNDTVSCSHFPFFGGGGFYFARMYADRSYLMGIRTDKDFPGGMYLSAEEPKRSIRYTQTDNGGRLIIIGGEGHKTGQGICTIQHYEALETFGEDVFGIKEIAYRWSAQDLVTMDKLPYIGQTTSDTPHHYIATGYRKWGMSSGTAAALLLKDLIMGKENKYAQLYTPSRFYADPSLKTLIVENVDVAKHLIAGKLEIVRTSPDELGNDEGAAVTINGKRAGAYRDQQGRLHVVDTTCTHMGCEVEWNDGERTWDCPCHGSRFSYNGEVLEGPAKKPLKIIEA